MDLVSKQKYVKNFFAILSGLITWVVFFKTVQPSVSFWDCGEAAAAGYGLQVPHPPGSPFFTIMARIFSMFPIVENVGLRINLLSVTASAVTIFLLYHIIVKVIENYTSKEYKSASSLLATVISAFTAALAAAFSHSFWFNGTESELYATNTVVFAAIIYVAMVWNEKANDSDNLKYIILIAYLIGVSTTLRAFGILAIIPTVLIIMYRKFVVNEEELKKSALILLAHAGILLIVALLMWNGQTSSTPPNVEQYKVFDKTFMIIMAAISGVIMLIFRKQTLNRNSIYVAIIVGAAAKFIIYPGVVQYIPKYLGKIAGTSTPTAILLLVLLFSALGVLIYYSNREKNALMQIVGLVILFIIIGYTSFTMVMVRANQNTPMNEDEPKTFSEFVSYLNREQYGDWPTFKRRFSMEPNQQGVFNNYDSDAEFLWKYQMNHMMTRYILWTYGGRESWNQDAGPNVAPFNGIANVFGKAFNLKFAGDTHNSFYGIPFLIGLLGLFFHFRRDWKMATAFLILFIMVTYLFAFYQNQQQPQPRERDKFYAAAGFVFAVWIGIAMRSLYEIVTGKLKEGSGVAVGFAILALGLVFIPARMLAANYHEHDRSQNWIPWDYAYNMLQSCEPNAILFTNGDNDTFPLWYLQDVEGVRRDVRIANLSLINTNWYAKQLKNNTPYGTPAVDMALTDEAIDALTPMEWTPKRFFIPIDAEQMAKLGVTDSTIIAEKGLSFTQPGTFSQGQLQGIRFQDVIVREIILANAFKRPIYFATTCTEDTKVGLSNYLVLEGTASKLVPQKQSQSFEAVNQKFMIDQLLHPTNKLTKGYQRGFSFRGIADKNIFLDENMERMVQTYRNSFYSLAASYVTKNQMKDAADIIDKMHETIPLDHIPMDYRLLNDVNRVYYEAGIMSKYAQYAAYVEKDALKAAATQGYSINNYYDPARILVEVYSYLKEYNKALEIMRLAQPLYQNDARFAAEVSRLQKLAAGGAETSIKK